MAKYTRDFNGHSYFGDGSDEFTQSPKKKKSPAVLAFLLLLVGGTYLVQTTLAADISLNTGAPVEFGQGITQTVACSGATNLTITPSATFTNVSGAGAHYLSSIKVSNIPSNCEGSDFTISAYGNTDSAPLALFNSTSTSAVIYNNAGTFEAGVGTVSGASITSGSGTFTVTFAAPASTTNAVYKVTIQSGAHTVVTCALGGTCSVGEIGPGGGKIYYYNVSGFNCGPSFTSTGSPTGGLCHYLETAPNTWPDSGTDPSLAWTASGAPRTADIAGIANDASNYRNIASVGLGYKNSEYITTQSTACSSPLVISSCIYAAGAARAYRGGGVSDWYLPTYSELNLACQWANGLTIDVTAACAGGSRANGDFVVNRYYWSSSEGDASNAWYLAFGDGGNGSALKSANVVAVRPIRAF